MAKPAQLTSSVSLLFNRPKPTIPSMFFRLVVPARPPCPPFSSLKCLPLKLQSYFSTTVTPCPLQYDMIISRPANQPPPRRGRRRRRAPNSTPAGESEPDNKELDFDEWVDRKLSSPNASTASSEVGSEVKELDRSKRKYYQKRRKRMYGSDSEDEIDRRGQSDLVELKQEVVELRTLHKREEELYFYDAFAFPWEKDKHYKMVYQLEKKYFPDQCFDKAFLEPGQTNERQKKGKKSEKPSDVSKGQENENKGLVFFEEGEEILAEKDGNDDVKIDISEKKVEEFFKCLKKVPNKDGEVAKTEPFLSSRSLGLPPKWDSPGGTVLLVNKPKGWTSFTVCGKLRRLVKVKKVGHAGTLDPMATGLLIVCIGKATKVVDWYQGMTKGYSGIFRLGEATSTWDAESQVIQREPWEHIKDADIKKAAASFCGEIWQVPPMFSAIKVGGERLYEKARRGESIDLSPRRISIFQFEVERSMEDRQNVVFRVICSKGTYIRSLCADFGKALGSCAHLAALRRDSIGDYAADDAWEFQELEAAMAKEYM